MLTQRELDAIAEDLRYSDPPEDDDTRLLLLAEVKRLRKKLEQIAAGEHGSSEIENPWGEVDKLLGPRGTVVVCRRFEPHCNDQHTYYEGYLANGYGWYVDSKAEVVSEDTGKRYPLTEVRCGAVKFSIKKFIATEQEVLSLLHKLGWNLSKAMEKRSKANG